MTCSRNISKFANGINDKFDILVFHNDLHCNLNMQENENGNEVYSKHSRIALAYYAISSNAAGDSPHSPPTAVVAS